jgi:hypothetical protein
MGVFLTVEALIIGQAVRGPHVSVMTRLRWGYFLGLVPTLLVAAACAVITYVRTLRNARARLGPGTVVRSGFAPHYFVIADSLGTGMTAYAAVRGVTVRGDFVLLRVVGRTNPGIAPRALFPDSALARMR